MAQASTEKKWSPKIEDSSQNLLGWDDWEIILDPTVLQSIYTMILGRWLGWSIVVWFCNLFLSLPINDVILTFLIRSQSSSLVINFYSAGYSDQP
jgi:hypothetical protein